MTFTAHRMSIRLLSRLLDGSRSRQQVTNLSTSFSLSCKINIPNKIQRSATDILKVLSSTVGVDTTGPHYKYHDDPYLTPASTLDKRSFSLSKEAGRKAARWIRDQNPQYFTHRPEDPFIEAFYPKMRYNEDSDLSEATLCELIQKSQVSDAINVYQICQSKGVGVSEETCQALLELVCYYNCEDVLDQEWVEERWYQQEATAVRKTWKDNGFAEDLFNSLSNKGPAAYFALIRGMAKYYQVERAWQLYQECREKGIVPDTNTFNSLIRITSLLRDSSDLRWQLVKELLQTMAQEGLRPNLRTLNSTLEALSQMAGWRQTRGLSLQVLAEFAGAGVQPSLASFYHLLLIHCRERGPVSHILLDILDHVEGKELKVQDTKDTLFFVTAMNVARFHLESLEVGERINNLLQSGKNYELIGDSFKESVYYRNFFVLKCVSSHIGDFMEFYHTLVPHIYTVEPGVMEEILKVVEAQEGFEHLPLLWSDMILFDHTSRERLVTKVLSVMASFLPSQDQPSTLPQQLAKMAADLWTMVQEQNQRRRNKILWTGQMVGDLITILVRCGDYPTAVKAMQQANTNAHDIVGIVPVSALQTMLRAAIQEQDADTAVMVVIYGQDAGHQETGEMALELRDSLTLSPPHLHKLTANLGSDLMKTPDPV